MSKENVRIIRSILSVIHFQVGDDQIPPRKDVMCTLSTLHQVTPLADKIRYDMHRCIMVISAFRDLGLSELGLFGGDLGLFCGDLGPVLW